MIRPDPEDYEAIEATHGKLPTTATNDEQAHRYRLALAAKYIRLHTFQSEQGRVTAANDNIQD